jgi:PAS domain S-box-containing protein
VIHLAIDGRIGQQIPSSNGEIVVNAGKNILIVNNNMGVTKRLTRILKKNGFDTETTRTGRDAMKLAKKRSFDVVLLDSSLNDTEGVELLTKFKEIYPETSVILMLNQTPTEKTVNAASKGLLPFISKPLDTETVVTIVEESLKDQSQIENGRPTVVNFGERTERFRQLAEASNDIVFQSNLDGTVAYCSPSVEKHLGYTQKEMIGTHFKEFCPDSELAKAADVFMKVLAGEEVELHEMLILKKDKTLLPVEINTTAIKVDGKIVGTQGIARDITERVHAEEALRHRDAILDAVSYAAQKYLGATSWEEEIDGILERLGLATEVCRVNIFENYKEEEGELLTSLRYEWAEAGKTSQINNSKFQKLSFRSSGLGRWMKVMEGGEIIEGQVKDFPESERKAILVQETKAIMVVPIFVRGDWWGFIGFNDCRTERLWSSVEMDALKTAASTLGAAIQREISEEELIGQKVLIEEIFQNVQEGIGIVDENENIIFCNPAYASIFDEKQENVVGKNLRDFLDAAAMDGIIDQIEARKTGKTSVYDLKIMTIKGNQKYIRVTASPRLDEDGLYAGAFGSIRDITDKKIARDELKKSEEKYRDLVDNSVIGIFQSNLSGEILFVNDSLVKMMEYESPEEMLKGGAIKLYKDREDRERLIRRLKKEKKIDNIVIEVVTKKGNEKFFNLNVVLNKDILSGTAIDVTGRVVAEQELVRTKSYLQHVFSSSPSVIYSCSINSRSKETGYAPAFISDNLKQMFGYDPEECLGDEKWWIQHIHPEDATQAVENMKILFTEGHLVHEYRVRHRKGDYRWVSDELVLVKDTSGKPIEFVGSWSDITDRKSAEDKLRESEHRFRAIFDYATDGICVIDLENLAVHMVNDRFCNMMGYEQEEIKDLKVPDLHPESEISWVIEEFGKFAKGDVTESSDIPMERKDKSVFYADITRSIMTIYGKLYVVGFFRDTTERKETEDALRNSEKQFHDLVDNAVAGIIQSTPDGKILFANKALARMAGFDSVEKFMAAGALPRYKDPELRKEWIRKLKKKGRVDSFEAEMIDNKGIIGFGLSSSTFDGNIISTVSIDITERKRAEEALRKSQEELRNLSSYLQSIREEERTEISREIHDELGQSMTALKMNLAWLRGKLRQDQKDLLKTVNSMKEIVDDNLQIAKRISTELRPRLLDDLGLIPAIEWHSDDFQKNTGIGCKVTTSHKDIDLGSDLKTAIYRIYQEAMTNIYRHAKASEVKIKIKNDSNKLLLKVNDNGTGISDDKISDPLSFGLIGMKERAYNLGGEVTVQGEKNKGTTVMVTIPLQGRGKSR